jgi:large subunit ribosomal protein L24
MSSIKLKKQDRVKVMSGKAKGQEGRVIKVLSEENRVVVEGVNKVKKHQKPTRQDQKGGIIEKEMSIHISNVMLVSKSNEPVKVRKTVQNGKRVRVEQKTGKAID